MFVLVILEGKGLPVLNLIALILEIATKMDNVLNHLFANVFKGMLVLIAVFLIVHYWSNALAKVTVRQSTNVPVSQDLKETLAQKKIVL